jgi:hypothetical protein
MKYAALIFFVFVTFCGCQAEEVEEPFLISYVSTLGDFDSCRGVDDADRVGAASDGDWHVQCWNRLNPSEKTYIILPEEDWNDVYALE